MAEAIVSFAVERLGELLISEAKLLSGVRDQINELLGELKRMQCFLREADEKQNQDARVRQWVEDMRELAFKTEDVTETFAMEVPSNKSGFKQVLRRFACIFSQGVSRHNIATDINAIKAKISNLTESLKTYGITKGLDEGDTSSSLVDLKSRRTYPHDMIEKDFVGMEEDIEQLISYLKMKGPGCEVVSICGMICSAMGFPQLQELGLYGLTNLRKWRVDQGAMPNLSSLTIYTCTELEMLPEGLTYLTALRDLNIMNMPTTFTNKIKEEDGVDFYKISHISRVDI